MPDVSFVAKVEGKAPQVMPCEYCGEEFVYFMRQTGVGRTEGYLGSGLARAERRAAEIARQRLAAKLHRNRFNAVPCPRCFRFQPFMRGEAAREKYGGNSPTATTLVVMGGAACVVGALAAVMYNSGQALGLGIAGVGFGVILLGAWVSRVYRRRRAAYDPNELPEEEREKLARERCSTWAEFNHKQARRIAKQYREHAEEQKRERWLNEKTGRATPPAARVWLPPQAFTDGLSISLELTESQTVVLAVPVGTVPGTTMDLVPAARNEFPFQVVLLAILEAPPQASNATMADRKPS